MYLHYHNHSMTSRTEGGPIQNDDLLQTALPTAGFSQLQLTTHESTLRACIG